MARCDLTDREKQVVGELANGKTNREIAQALGVSVATVKQRITIVMIKWNCNNRTQLAIEAFRRDGGALAPEGQER